MEATIALAGNPNSGKTTLFNAITGARQHVGNYPGVTVEKKQGFYETNGLKMQIVDLPGTYSLTAYSLEEVVARNFLVDEKPAVVINIVDASNLERNLYLCLQFMEMGLPVVLALNMMDVAEKRGIRVDAHKLSKFLGVQVIPTVACSGQGKSELMAAAAQMTGQKFERSPLTISYGRDVDLVLDAMTKEINRNQLLLDRYDARWIALKYLENDEQVRSMGRQQNASLADKLEAMVEKLSRHLQETLDTYPEAEIADHRYGYITSLIRQGVIIIEKDQDRLFLSDKIDKVLTNRFAGPLIMMAAIMGLYHFTFTYSEMPVSWLEALFGWLGGLAETHIPEGLLKSLIISGVIDGVGGVLGFVPLIMFMFFGIAFLEDSGYLARVAFMLDRVFRFFGLHGNSVMPFIVSGGIAGGCAVPGVMATRILKSPPERLATILTAPFMNCGAKLPVFALLVAAFFTENKALVMLIITAISWLGALLVARVLRSTVIRGDSTPFVMELPPYRLPTLKGLFIHTWEHTWQYIKKAGTVILGISILLWALMTFPSLPGSQVVKFEEQRQKIIARAEVTIMTELMPSGEGVQLSETAAALKNKLTKIDSMEAEAALQHSVAGRIGTALEGLTSLAGFDWRTNIALVGGFAAKEVVVSTLGTAYSLGEIDPEENGSLAERLATAPGWSPLVALSLIIFTIFYAPCFVAVVCISREGGSWKWGAFSMVFNTALAFGLAVLVYQLGSVLGF
jgi:ferrous iron transport protein B